MDSLRDNKLTTEDLYTLTHMSVPYTGTTFFGSHTETSQNNKEAIRAIFESARKERENGKT